MDVIVGGRELAPAEDFSGLLTSLRDRLLA
jgi:hypothetical protein